MNQFRMATLFSFLILTSFVGSHAVAAPDDAKTSEEKSPDIAGEWLAESPLDSFVQDDSPQPVNSFRIQRSKTADFDVFYLGANALGIPVKWNQESRKFEGSKGIIPFVISTTDDPDVLKCEIGKSHQDKWQRKPKDAKAKPRQVRIPAGEKAGKPAEKPVLVYDPDDEYLTGEVQKRTEALMGDFYEYMKNVGFKLERGQCKLRAQKDMGNAHYFHNIQSIVIDPRYLTDDTVLYREFTHHALAVTLGDDATEIFQKCSGIESGLADFFGCSACDDPIVGRVMRIVDGNIQNGQLSYLRTMDNQRSFATMTDSSGRHAVGETLCGALWELRTVIDKDNFDALLLKAWSGIVKSDSSHGQVVRFVKSLLDVAAKEDPDLPGKITTILERRGLKLPSENE